MLFAFTGAVHVTTAAIAVLTLRIRLRKRIRQIRSASDDRPGARSGKMRRLKLRLGPPHPVDLISESGPKSPMYYEPITILPSTKPHTCGHTIDTSAVVVVVA